MSEEPSEYVPLVCVASEKARFMIDKTNYGFVKALIDYLGDPENDVELYRAALTLGRCSLIQAKEINILIRNLKSEDEGIANASAIALLEYARNNPKKRNDLFTRVLLSAVQNNERLHQNESECKKKWFTEKMIENVLSGLPKCTAMKSLGGIFHDSFFKRDTDAKGICEDLLEIFKEINYRNKNGERAWEEDLIELREIRNQLLENLLGCGSKALYAILKIVEDKPPEDYSGDRADKDFLISLHRIFLLLTYNKADLLNAIEEGKENNIAPDIARRLMLPDLTIKELKCAQPFLENITVFDLSRLVNEQP